MTVGELVLPKSKLDVAKIRNDFPALNQKINGHPLVYLDSAASSQTPLQVVRAMDHFYDCDRANIHRGVHELSQRATKLYENGRASVRDFLNATEACEIIFTRGTTEAINLIASTYGRQHVGAEDEIVISEMEHHSNIVPWQMLCEAVGAKLSIIPIDDNGNLIVDRLGQIISEKTKIVSVTHVSNALGTVNPVKELANIAHQYGAVVVVDGAQATPHIKVDVQDLDCDFYAFSGHKMYGPTGIGVLYGKRELLEDMPPYQGGGEMIQSVSFTKTTYNQLPFRFEAGTPNIVGVIGLAAAIDYLQSFDFPAVQSYEQEIHQYALNKLKNCCGVKLISNANQIMSVISFLIDGIHPHDVGTILDRQGIAVRAGHHCAQPLMDRLNVPATVRASFALYNTKEEADALVKGIEAVRKVFA